MGINAFSSKSIMSMLVLFLTFLTLSFALDLSIVSYDSTHGDKSSWRSDDEVMAMYESWLVKHGKVYNALGEKEERFQIFKDNLGFIDEHNSKNLGYKLGLNRFADLTNKEYRSKYLGARAGPRTRVAKNPSNRYMPRVGEELPESVDWREQGAVADIKDQGDCGGGGWAFSTISAVEGIHMIKTGSLEILSEQELLDCETRYNQGCNGGVTDYAFEFIISNGVKKEEDYPFQGVDGECEENWKSAHVTTIDDYEDVPVNDEKALQKAVANQPVSVTIKASGNAFQFYESGVFTGECGTEANHSAVAVGYGTDNGTDYWIVRNSWGASWGEGGYMRMERNVASSTTGKCGIAMEASYPVKDGQSPSTVCDDKYSCPQNSTCCCIGEVGNECFAWGCCPSGHPVCDVNTATCLRQQSEDNPFRGKALKTSPAKFRRINDCKSSA